MKTNQFKKTGVLVLLLVLALGSPRLLADQRNYFQNIGYDYVRGFKNMLSAPAEIVLGVRDYPANGEAGWIRGTRGFFDGSFKMINRFMSGAWDLFAAVIPGYQEGIPPAPETLF